MKTLILFMFMLFNLTLIEVGAKTLNTKVSGDTKVVYLDDNNDKKVDLIETYKKNVLVKKEQDLNFDGVMDETTDYFYGVPENKPSVVVTNKDRQSKIYRNEKLKLIIKTTEIDTNGDGKYDKTITENFPLVQHTENCTGVCSEGPKIVPEKTVVFSEQVLKIVDNKKDSQYVENKLGYNIHKSCLDNYGQVDFSNIVTESMTKGLACLEDLAKKNTKDSPKGPNGALNNYEGLNRLLEKSKVTIVCNEQGYDWEGTAGHASTHADEKIKELGVGHPFISINPKNPDIKGKPTGKEVAEMTETIFHEQLHNLGILHGKDVEYPYACETCCLSPNEEFEGTKAAACKICSGQYDVTKGTSEQYLKDLVDWGQKSYDTTKAENAIHSYQLEHPKSLWAASLAARANAGIFSAVGIEMAKILKQKSPLTPDSELTLAAALEYKDTPKLVSVSDKAKVIALANLNFYYEQSPKETIKVLKENKMIIKKIVTEGKREANDSELNYINKQLLKDAKDVLMAVFLNGYPDHETPANNQAYDLLKELGLL